MEQLLRALLSFVLLTVTFFGFFAVLNVLFPRRVARTQAILQTTAGRSFWIGLVNLLFFLPIALLLLSLADASAGPLKAVLTIPALLILAVLLGLASFGLLGVVNLVGERTMPEQPLLKQTFWGSLLVGLASALPFIGWFLFLPYVLIIGVGAVLLGLLQRGE